MWNVIISGVEARSDSRGHRIRWEAVTFSRVDVCVILTFSYDAYENGAVWNTHTHTEADLKGSHWPHINNMEYSNVTLLLEGCDKSQSHRDRWVILQTRGTETLYSMLKRRITVYKSASLVLRTNISYIESFMRWILSSVQILSTGGCIVSNTLHTLFIMSCSLFPSLFSVVY